MTDTEKAEYERVIRLLTEKLQETVGENDRLRTELARQTEGASAYATLSDIHRNRDLPAAVRAKAAIGCLPHEKPKLTPVPPPIDLVAEPPPIAELVHQQRARMDRLLALPLEERSKLIAGVGDNGGNGGDDTFS